jgi:hypothetical protein
LGSIKLPTFTFHSYAQVVESFCEKAKMMILRMNCVGGNLQPGGEMHPPNPGLG